MTRFLAALPLVLFTMAVQAQPPGDADSTLSASVTLKDVELRELLTKLEVKLDYAVSGKVTVKANVSVPLGDAAVAKAYRLKGQLSSPELKLEGLRIRDLSAEVLYADGKLTLTSLKGTLPPDLDSEPLGEFRGSATAAIEPRGDLTANLTLTRLPLGELLKAVTGGVPVVGAVNGKAQFRGAVNTLSDPTTWVGSAELTAAKLTVSGQTVRDAVVTLDVRQGRAVAKATSAELFGGTLSGSATVPLVAAERGDFTLTVAKIDAAAVAKTFPKVPVKLTGLVSGKVTGTIPAAKPNEQRAITATVELTADALTVQGIPAKDLVGKLSVEGTAVKYELEGKTLGGSFEVNGQYPQAPKKAPDDPQSRVQLRNLDLARLAEALKQRGLKLRGVVDLTFVFAPDLSEGTGRYSIRGFGWNNTVMLPELSGRIRLREGTLELTDSVGPLASGTVRARLRLGLDEPARNFFRVSVDRVDMQHLFDKLTGTNRFLEGGVSLTVRGRLWPEFQASGTLALANGRLAGLTASDVRVPFTVNLRRGGGEVVIRDAGGTIGNGRLTGQFEYLWGTNGRLQGDVKFTNIKVGNVLTDLKQANYFANARMTGRIELKGENMTSANDLTGTLTATLEQAAVRDLPILNQVAPFIPPTAITQPFDAGELRGRLSRGVFRIEQLTLANPTADLYADGAVTLAGRLDLGVIVRTGQLGLNDTILRQTGLRLPVLPGPLPITFIRDISVFLSNRTIRLTVSGTIDSPQVRLNTSALLTEEAIRFLLRRYLPAAAASVPEVSPRSRR